MMDRPSPVIVSAMVMLRSMLYNIIIFKDFHNNKNIREEEWRCPDLYKSLPNIDFSIFSIESHLLWTVFK